MNPNAWIMESYTFAFNIAGLGKIIGRFLEKWFLTTRYGETGANEPTTLSSNLPLEVQGNLLPAGKYSIWTIPREDEWSIIFNSDIPLWGVNLNGKVNRDPALDVLIIQVPTIQIAKQFDQFSIYFEDFSQDQEMLIIWDHTMVVIPISLP